MNGHPAATVNVGILGKYFRRGVREQHEVELICDLLQTVDVNSKFDELPLVLLYMEYCETPDMIILKKLASCGANFNVQDSRQRSPLHWIVAKPQVRSDSAINAIKMIINHGGNPGLADSDEDNVLHFALVEKMNKHYISAILEGQPKPSKLVSAKNKKGWTPTRILASRNLDFDIETFQILKDYGVDVNEKDEDGNTLLHILFSKLDYTKLDIYERDVMVFPVDDWRTAFTTFKDIVKAFVEAGANVNVKNNLKYVPMRLAIDLQVPLEDIKPLIPTVDILNDDSCWGGPVIDYVLKNSSPITDKLDEFVKALLDKGANRASKETLMMAIRHPSCGPELVDLVVTKLDRRVTFEELEETKKLERPVLIAAMLSKADDEMIKQVKVRWPNILVEVSDFCIKDYFKKPPISNLITLLVENFDIDINYKKVEGDEGLLLHNLVRYTKLRNDELSSLDLVLNMENLKINETIKIDVHDGDANPKKDMTALDFALHSGNYKAAESLINNFADTKQLAPISVSIHSGFAHSFQLLSVLGQKFDFMDLLAAADARLYREVEYVKTWVTGRAEKVHPLKELSALAVRRHISKQGLNQLIAEIEIPEPLQDILFLKSFKCDFVSTVGDDDDDDEFYGDDDDEYDDYDPYSLSGDEHYDDDGDDIEFVGIHPWVADDDYDEYDDPYGMAMEEDDDDFFG